MAEQSSWSTLNTTKLYIPQMPEDFVPRRRLDDLLNRIVQRPFTLISAPAGYGKSTAAAAWLQSCTLRQAWLSLDDTDNELAVFLLYFVAAIGRALPTFGVELGTELEAGRMLSAPAFAETIFAELDRLNEAVVLVMEDAHLIHGSEVLGILRELMRHPHPLLHLVLLSRRDMPLPLNDWRVRNWMFEVRAADLRFSLEETNRFLNNAVGDSLKDETVALLHKNTEGWVAGLRLALLSLVHTGDIEDQVIELSAHNRHVVEYLAEQVLNSLPDERQAFLIQTSILDRISGPLCEAVVAVEGNTVDGQLVLHDLNRENLFTISLDSEMIWFRYHHLLREFLHSRLVQSCSPAEIAALHLRAGRWFASAGYVEEAIRHTIAAGEMEEAVGYLAAKRHELINHEQWSRLMSWYGLFPEHIVNHSPDLLLIRAWAAHSLRFDIEEVRIISNRLEELIDHLDMAPRDRERLQAENDVLHGIQCYYQLDAPRCLEFCRHALEVLPAAYYTTRSFAWVYTVGAHHLLGDSAGAFEVARLAQREDLSFPDYPRVRNVGAEGYVCWMAGDLPGVERVGKLIMTTAATGTQYNSLSWGHYFLASAHYHWNNLAEAEYHAQQIFDNRFINHAIANVYSGYILALIHQANARPEAARNTLAQTAAFATQVRSPALNFLAQAFQAELDTLQGRTDKAVSWVKQVLSAMQPRPMPFFFAPHLVVPKALLAANDPADRAVLRDYLHNLRTHVEATHNNRFLIEVLALEALFHDAQGNERAALVTLEHSLALAKPSGFIRVYVDLGAHMMKLLGRLRHGKASAGYVARILAAFPSSKPVANGNGTLIEPLTERELQVLTLLARRYSNKEIATELVISPMTVKRHTINIYQKLFVQSRREAVQTAQRLGIIS